MKWERVIALGIVAALSAALATSEFARFADREILNERLTETQETAQAALEAVIEPSVMRDADQSVYMVRADGKHIGTAFVIDRERGILATAAHVAVVYNFHNSEQSQTILNRFSGKPLRVRSARIHSGFFDFRRRIENHQPIDPDSTINDLKPQRIYDLPHDGALLYVDPIDPETGENILGASLPIASDATLNALKTGDPIATIGFPIDTITDNLEEESAASRSERGVISNLLSPIDLIENHEDKETQLLIVHRMSIAPGSSGGPLFNRNGEVIGINSHSNASRYSVGDGVAQRADVLHELNDPHREQDLLERVFRPSWQERVAKWPSARDALPAALYAQAQGKVGKSVKVSELEASSPPPYTTQLFDRQYYGFRSAFVHNATDLASNSSQNNDLAAQTGPVFRINKSGFYYNVRRNLPADKTHAIFAFDYTLDWNQAGACRVELYHRRHGDDTLKTTGMKTVASAIIPARSDATTKPEVDIIVRSGNCDASSNRFLWGIVSWTPGEQPSIAPVAALNAAGAQVIRASTAAQNFVDCHGVFVGDREACARAVKIENITPAASK